MINDRPHRNSDAKKQFKGTHPYFYGSLKEFAYTENFTAPPEIIDGWEDMDLGDLLNYIEVKYKLGIRAGYGAAFTLGEWDIEIRDFGVCGTRDDFYTGFPVFHMSQKVSRTASMNDVNGACLSYAVYYAFQYINADYPAKKWNEKYWNNGPTLTLNELGTWKGERWERLEKDDC